MNECSFFNASKGEAEDDKFDRQPPRGRPPLQRRQGLGEFLSHRQRSIEAALGLVWPRGGVPWWLEEAMRQRDAALRELAQRFYGGQAVSRQAAAIYRAALRYAASRWRRDRGSEALPPEHLGTPYEWLWRAFKSGAAMPIGDRQLRHILMR